MQVKLQYFPDTKMDRFLIGKPKPKPKRVPVITISLRGCRTHIDRVTATIYFEITGDLYGIELRFIQKNGKTNRFHSDFTIPDPYKHMEHIIGACINNLQKMHGGYVKVEKYEESSKTKQFNRSFFNMLEMKELSV